MTGELTCNSCKNRVQLNNMRYAKDGSGLICNECYNKQTGKTNLRIKPEPFRKPAESSSKKKVTYLCTSCSFRFTRAIDFRGPMLCPNCSRDTIRHNLPNDTDELLRELELMDDV